MREIDLLDEINPPCPRGCGRTTDACGEAADGAGCTGGELWQENQRLRAQLAEAERRFADAMYRNAYFAINKLMDKAHGPNAADGAGAGLQEDVALLIAQRDALCQHSTTLNTVAWKLAFALGDVTTGAEQMAGNPAELADRIVDELKRARAERDATANAARRHARIFQACTDQILADIRTTRSNLAATECCATCGPIVQTALNDLGELLPEPTEDELRQGIDQMLSGMANRASRKGEADGQLD